MPKLIRKQATDKSSEGLSKSGWLTLLALSIVTVLAVGGWFLSSSSKPKKDEVVQALPVEIRSEYEKHRYSVRALDVAYNAQLKRKQESKEQIESLISQIKLSLQHLDDMDLLILDAGLEGNESDQILEKIQYQKDDWQAKLHFQELRLTRLVPDEFSAEASLDDMQAFPEDSVPPSLSQRFQFAKPPEGVELPSDACTITADGDQACKPDLSQNATSEAEAVSIQ